MSAAVAEAPGKLPVGMVSWEEYQAEKDLRAEARRAKRPLQMECLDPEKAAEYEAKKPRFTYEVNCTYRMPGEDGRLELKSDKRTVQAHNETDAWARFCDAIKHWPSRSAVELEIKKVGK